MMSLPPLSLRPRLVYWLLILFSTLCLFSVRAHGEEGAGSDVEAEIARLTTRLQAIEAESGSGDSTREDSAELYRRAIAALRSAAANQHSAAQQRAAAIQAPRQIAQLQKELEQLGSPLPTLATLEKLSLAELSSRADALGQEHAELQTSLLELRNQLAQLAVRPHELRQSLSELRERLRQLEPAERQPAEAALTRAASEVLLQAQRRALSTEIDRKEQELAGIDGQEQLLEARRTLAETRLLRISDSLNLIREALGRKQNASARALLAASTARLDTMEDAPLALQQAAGTNVALAQELVDITARVQQLTDEQRAGRELVTQLERRYNLVQRQLGIGSGSVALSTVLREQQRALANAERRVFKQARQHPDASALALRRFQLQQDEEELGSRLLALRERSADDATETLNAAQQTELRALLIEQRNSIQRLIDAQGRQTTLIRNVDGLATQYQSMLASFDALLHHRRFWLPSAHPVDQGWWARVAAGVGWLMQGAHWQESLVALGSGIRSQLAGSILALLSLLALLWQRPWLRRQLHALAEPVGNVRRDSIWATLGATAISVLLALPAILFCLFLGVLLELAPAASDFARAVGEAAIALAILGAFVQPFTNLCRLGGVAASHFKWPVSACNKLRHHLHRMLVLMAIPVFIISLTEAIDDDTLRESIGRASFMLSQLTMLVFSWHILHPRRGALAIAISGDNDDPWRPGYVWLPLTACVLFSLFMLTWLGHYYAALKLQAQFFVSVAALGLAVVAYHLTVRWLTVTERRLAFDHALRRRSEILKAREAEGGNAEPQPDSAAGLDLVQISEQTRGLIKLGVTLVVGLVLWRIWSGTLPALQGLNNIALWQQTVTDASGRATVSSITLGSVLIAAIVGIGTVTASRNLPGFLEMTLLRRFDMGPGSRYAVATLIQYAIVFVGLLIATSYLGIDASSVRWLIAAMGVGLGFGLQEIFANFVSGLILLFERPVRVGDTVTVGNILGTVTRIRIRATTITDWDKREVIIPNRSFVTETVTNWTLSDDVARIILRFHVSPEADGERVQQLMREAVAADAVVLTQPEPSAYMVGYDERGCIFELRVYYRDLSNWLPLQHRLYRRIQTAFQAEGIDIAFPQRSVHLHQS